MTFEVRCPAPEVVPTGKGNETPAPDTGIFAKTVDSVCCTTESVGSTFGEDTETKHIGSCLGEKSHEEPPVMKENIPLMENEKTHCV